MQRYYTLRPSYSFALLYSLVFVVSLVSLWQQPLPVLTELAASMAVLCAVGYRLLLDAALRLRHSCVAFNLDEGGHACLAQR